MALPSHARQYLSIGDGLRFGIGFIIAPFFLAIVLALMAAPIARWLLARIDVARPTATATDGQPTRR